ncbi:13936_t:CDS:2, partial [Ambispora leptoticha]
NIPKSNTGLVSVFVENSNLFIEGKYTVSLIKERKIGSNLVIVGSRPSWNDSLWDRVRNQDFDVIIYDRIANKEKKVNMELELSIVDVIYLKDPGIVLIIAGDSDYTPAINWARDNNWKIEGYPDPSGRSCTLEITDGETLAK